MGGPVEDAAAESAGDAAPHEDVRTGPMSTRHVARQLADQLIVVNDVLGDVIEAWTGSPPLAAIDAGLFIAAQKRQTPLAPVVEAWTEGMLLYGAIHVHTRDDGVAPTGRSFETRVTRYIDRAEQALTPMASRPGRRRSIVYFVPDLLERIDAIHENIEQLTVNAAFLDFTVRAAPQSATIGARQAPASRIVNQLRDVIAMTQLLRDNLDRSARIVAQAERMMAHYINARTSNPVSRRPHTLLRVYVGLSTYGMSELRYAHGPDPAKPAKITLGDCVSAARFASFSLSSVISSLDDASTRHRAQEACGDLMLAEERAAGAHHSATTFHEGIRSAARQVQAAIGEDKRLRRRLGDGVCDPDDPAGSTDLTGELTNAASTDFATVASMVADSTTALLEARRASG